MAPTLKLCVLNQKGGTGKTTTSIHLAAALSRRGFKTLLIDNDPQGSIAVSLKKNSGGLKEVLKQEIPLEEALQSISPSLDILASDYSLISIEADLHQKEFTEKEMELYANALTKEKILSYSHIIIDMAPSRSKLNEAALYFSDEVLIPVSCDYLALVGVRDILQFLDQLNDKRPHPLRLRGILPTLYDPRNRISKETVEMLRQHFPQSVYPPIHHTTKVKEAPSHGKTLFEYAPQSRAALDYEWLSNLF